jgi:hypothetical protein
VGVICDSADVYVACLRKVVRCYPEFHPQSIKVSSVRPVCRPLARTRQQQR